MQTLTVTSIQAQNAEFVVDQICEYLGERLGCDSRFFADTPWTRRVERLGHIDVAWMCGLPYVRRVDAGDRSLEPLVAAVMSGSRYDSRPIYFSDLMVHSKSPYRCFEDLRGATWSYNEPNSQSGYNIVRHHLSCLGENREFFGTVIEAGAHVESLRLLSEGEVDGSAIDSTVLEMELAQRPERLRDLRKIGVLGPSPIPPWVVRASLHPSEKERIRLAFTDMHSDPAGREILQAGSIDRFVSVTDADYDPIREMDRVARAVEL